MAEQSGYFDDGTTALELGESTYATPTAMDRRLARVEPHSRPASVHDSGGGVQEVQVHGGRLREDLGDAERYAYEQLADLATAGHGTLGVRDVRSEGGNSYEHTWSDAVCVEATATIRAHRWVSLEARFLAPTVRPTTTTTSGSTTTTAGSSWPAPDPPGTYSGTSTSQDYAAGGVDLGVGGRMDLEMVRSAELRTVPRARGAVPGPPRRGAVIILTVEAHARGEGQHLAARLAELERGIGAMPVDLTANGNTYNDVVLRGLSPEPSQYKSTSFSAEFVKEL